MTEMDRFTGHTIVFTKTFNEFKHNNSELYSKYLKECPNWKNINSIPNEFKDLFEKCLDELKDNFEEIQKEYPTIFE